MKLSELNILLVEDDSFQRGLIIEMIQSVGVLAISDVEDGVQAMEKIRGEKTKPVDIVICDLNMPKMDGLEFLRHLGQEKHNAAIIIVSALGYKLMAAAGTIAKLYGIKVLGTIEKPVTLAQLKTLLLTFERSENKLELTQVSKTPSFTLEEILQGIRNKQFEPHFQPKIDLKSGQLVGAETLARWIHPKFGLIPSIAFIPQLEKSGNIDDLTILMLERTAAVSRLFQDKNLALILSVNLSLTSLSDVELADKFTKLVRSAGIEPKFIILEITVTAAMTEDARSLENISRLCLNGFQLSIDNYGTGFTNIQQLTRLAFSELKIDQGLVKEISSNKSSRIVVESTIDMAHKLQVKCVANGVETQKDWDALKSGGCDIAQGFFISKPLGMKDFYNFASRYKNDAEDITHNFIQHQSRLKILIVDDDDFSRKLVINLLTFLGYAQIKETGSAKSAIKLFEMHTFDLIISDVYMPEMNGLELIKMIRTGKTRAKADIRILILTSFAQSEVLKLAIAFNTNGILVKPITPADMGSKIEKIMTTNFKLQSPAIYDAVTIELGGMIETATENLKPGIKQTDPVSKIETNDEKVSHIEVQRVSPGMVLNENITLSDGTLLLSRGHIFTNISIKRLNNLRGMLEENSVAIMDVS
jgi:EAL domain-containing protein (putative c-di-GMP-specific phosphodiesterase class I)/DNA-binding NarL/FixJ family response regulator